MLHIRTFNWRAALTLAVLALLVAACGGTKVYDTTRTVVYNDAVYNVTDTKTISSVVEGTLPDGSTVNLRGMDRKAFEALLEQHDAIDVRMSFMLDEQEMLYRKGSVDSWRDFDRMNRDMADAQKDINKLMREGKTKQIKLS
jgi:hypothetical protein